MNIADFTARLRTYAQGRTASGAELQALAQRWCEVVEDCIRRIERAGEWARRGLRTEAMALAEASPSVFEVAESARDPAMSIWRNFCKREGLPQPPELPVQSLDRLRECFVQLEPLRDLLARWRKLNLGRAPATERLDQLRRLRAVDPINPTWLELAPALEQAALREANEACERALALWELDRVESVVAWIEAGEWLQAPAHETAVILRRRIRELSGRSALERARIVVDRLHQEYMAESIDAAQGHLREWEALRAFLADSGVELPQDLTQSLQPVLEWIHERQETAQRLVEHRNRLAELAAAVESPTITLDELSSLYARVSAGPEPPSTALGTAARRRIGALRRARARRRTLLIAAGLFLAAFLGLAAKTMLDRHARNIAGEKLLLTVGERLSQDDLDGARRVLAEKRESEPTLADHPSLQVASARIAAAAAAIVRRDEAFAQQLEALGDPASPDADLRRVETLEQLSRTPEHRAALEQWQLMRARAMVERRRQADAAFAESLTQLEREVDLLASSAPQSPETVATRVAQLLARVEAIESLPELSMAARARTGPVRLRLDTIERVAKEQVALARRLAEESQALEQLRPLVDRPSELAMAMDRFSERFPDSVHADGFRVASMDRRMWEAAMAWPAAAASARGLLRTGGEDERAEARRRLRAYIDAHPQSAHASAAQGALQWLNPQGDWRRWFSGVLDGSPLFALRMVELRNGERYYYEEQSPPTPATEDHRVYRVVRGLRDPARGLFETEFLRINPRDIVFDGDSPQRRFATQYRADLRAGAFGGFDGAFTVMGRVRDSTDIDALVRTELLVGLLRQVSRALPGLAGSIDEAERRLVTFQPANASWLDPRISDARDRSREAAAALPRIIESDRWRERWHQETRQAEQNLLEAFEPVGILLRTAESATLQPGERLAPGPLFAVVSRSGAMAITEVGSVNAALLPELSLKSLGDLPSGTLLFQRSLSQMPSASANPAPSAPSDQGPPR